MGTAHILAAPDAGHRDGRPGPLGDLEGARVEGQHLAGFAAGALRVNAHVADPLLQIIRRLQDGLQGFPVILPVDGQKARPLGDGSRHRDLQVGGLGDEGDVVLLHGAHNHQRVEHGLVVADEQELLVLGQLLQAAQVYPDAGVKTKQIPRPGTAGPAEIALLFQLPLRAEQADKGQTQHIDQMDAQQGQHIGRDQLPQPGRAGHAAQSRPEHRCRRRGQVEEPYDHFSKHLLCCDTR